MGLYLSFLTHRLDQALSLSLSILMGLVQHLSISTIFNKCLMNRDHEIIENKRSRLKINTKLTNFSK